MSFAHSLRVAFVCAVACGLWLALAQPLVGRTLALQSGLAAAAAAYLIGIAPRRVRGTTAAALLLASSAVLILAGVRIAFFASALAVTLGVLRSTWLWRVPRGDAAAFARRFMLELALVAGGLAFAAELGHTGVFREALALWGFLLVQSVFFVLDGGAAAAASAEEVFVDPFEVSCRRLRAVLEKGN